MSGTFNRTSILEEAIEVALRTILSVELEQRMSLRVHVVGLKVNKMMRGSGLDFKMGIDFITYKNSL